MHTFDDMDEALLCFDCALVQRNQSADDDDNHGLLCAEVHLSTMKMKPVLPFKRFSIDSSSAAMGGSRQEVMFNFNFQLGKECVLLCFIKQILGNCYVRSRGFIMSDPRETHPRSEIADVPTLPCPPLDNLGCPDPHPPP